jgi:hypothetical protein
MEMGKMVRMLAIRRSSPTIQYIGGVPPTRNTVSVPPVNFPKPMIIFYVSGLLCSVAFASLLALSALGTNVIHPFLSLLGLVGGLGWLTTAWSDLLLSKREKLATKTGIREQEPVDITAR